jgi:dephospho-CoA kinase
MLYTDADPELRYERMVMRQRDSEAKITRAEFETRQKAEWYVGDQDSDFNKRDIRAYCESKDMIVYNEADLASFFHAAEEKLGLTE